MIVADTNLLIYLFIEGERTGESEAVQRQDPVWSAPVLWRSEFRNALIGLVRKGILALDDALPMMDEAERRLAGHEYTVVSRDVLLLADRSGCSAYGCEFIALAQDLGVSMVTTDRQILKAFPTIAVAPSAFGR